MYWKKVIGIGWDVGGWMGSNHGVAMCEWSSHRNTIHWNGEPAEISIPKNDLLSFEDITRAINNNFDLHTLDDALIIIGIDAPLGFPSTFHNLLTGKNISVAKPNKEIDSHLAYRYTDQEIYRVFGKKPLSASFDRIGNNTTVAMVHTRKWEEEHKFKTYPMSKKENSDNKIMIEVYPALVKKRRNSEAFNKIKKYLPAVTPGTDAYDASICALYAVAFGTKGAIFPLLQEPPLLDEICEEGWIYYFDKESIESLK